jgi:hypothetical protein
MDGKSCARLLVIAGFTRIHAATDSTFHADCVVTCVVSLHAAARRLQCGTSTSSDDDLLDDVALLAQHNVTEMIPEGQDFAVPTAGGSWFGRCIRLPDGGRRALSVRTWLPE